MRRTAVTTRLAAHPQRYLLGKRVLFDRQLPRVNRQFATAGSDDLCIHGAVNSGRDEPHRSVAKGHITATGMSAIGKRERALDREILAVVNVFVGPNPVRIFPRLSVSISLRLQLAPDTGTVRTTYRGRANKPAEIGQWAGPIGFGILRVHAGRPSPASVFSLNKSVLLPPSTRAGIVVRTFHGMVVVVGPYGP